jgi:hypothetical protein
MRVTVILTSRPTSRIRALLDQGCDLEADILPIVAREIPELPRPLKNWGAPWLVRDMLGARDQRLALAAGRPVEAMAVAIVRTISSG